MLIFPDRYYLVHSSYSKPCTLPPSEPCTLKEIKQWWTFARPRTKLLSNNHESGQQEEVPFSKDLWSASVPSTYHGSAEDALPKRHNYAERFAHFHVYGKVLLEETGRDLV